MQLPVTLELLLMPEPVKEPPFEQLPLKLMYCGARYALRDPLMQVPEIIELWVYPEA
jgi:hypothetical protein